MPMIITCAAWQADYLRAREAIDEALSLFYKTIELDPRFASAYGMAAWCYAWRKINGWMTDRVKEIAETERLARQAAESRPGGRGCPLSQCSCAGVCCRRSRRRRVLC